MPIGISRTGAKNTGSTIAGIIGTRFTWANLTNSGNVRKTSVKLLSKFTNDLGNHGKI